jgi:hypothetical protein
MKNITFRDIAMRGVAKGYWIYSLGKTCEPFQFVSVADVEGPQDGETRIPVIINVKGFPRTYDENPFRIDAYVEPVTCPSGVTCHSVGLLAIGQQLEGPYEYKHVCTGPSTGSFVARYRVTIKDRDGVKPPPMEYNVTCKPHDPASPNSSSHIYVDL